MPRACRQTDVLTSFYDPLFCLRCCDSVSQPQPEFAILSTTKTLSLVAQFTREPQLQQICIHSWYDKGIEGRKETS